MKAAPRQFFVLGNRDAVLVKHGFSWPAFFLGTIWAAVKGLWWPVFPAFLAAEVAVWVLGGLAELQGSLPVALLSLAGQLGFAWWRGHVANRWWRDSLQRRGYQPGVQR